MNSSTTNTSTPAEQILGIDNSTKFLPDNSSIDGDSTAQPICKQPLESGNVNNNLNSLTNQQIQNNCPGSGGGGGSGSTGSIGVIGCGYTSAANSTQQSTTNTQTA
jgi:hypothetical protein